ncbi:MAG: oligosaccharide flippase family protein [Lachnospiraceae bacterium]|nr:oligosaccharide flippase family protein [Lachnospiraceae bacterium]
MLLIPLYVRLMSTEEYGLYTLFQSWESIVLIFTTLNLAAYAFHNCLIRHEKMREQVTGAFLGLLCTLTAAACMIFGLSIGFWEEVFGFSGKYIIAMALDSMFIVAIDLWFARKKFDYQYQGIVVVTILNSLLNLGVGLALVSLSDEKAFAAVLTKVMIQGGITLVLAADIWRKGRCFFNKDIWKYVLCFNIPLIPHFLSSRILQQADRVMIQRFCGTSQAGIYGFSYKISEAMGLFNSALLSSMIPWTYRKLKEKKYSEIYGGVFPTLLLIGGLNLLLILLAPEAVTILGTDEYREAVYIIPPVACSIFLMYLFNVFVNITYFYEQKQLVVAASVTAAVLNVALNWMFIPKFGYLAAGYTTLASYICLACMHGGMYLYTLRKMGIREKIYNLPHIFLLATGFTALGIVSSLFYKGCVVRYLIVVIILIVTWANREKLLRLIKKTT